MTLARGSLLTVLAAALVAACDDSPPNDEPDCTSYDDLCDEDGLLRCAGRAIERCVLQASGCLRWRDHQECGHHQQCRGDGLSVSCQCEPGCADRGARECQADVIAECQQDADECLFWQGQTNCAGTGQICDVGEDGAPGCYGCPGDQCDEPDAVRCRRQVIQRCEAGRDGCLGWNDVEDCAAADPPGFCAEDDGVATCADECEDICDARGATRCSGTALETCSVQEYGCLDWDQTADCADVADYCDDAVAVAACAACDHECPAPGARRCSGPDVETCAEDEHRCRSWVVATDCSTLDPARLCEEDGDGGATCVPFPATGSCVAPIVVGDAHALFAGTDFTADFANDHHLRGRGCLSDDPTADAVFAVDLLAGQVLRVRETGDLDAVLSLQIVCGDDEVCVFSEDVAESAGRDYLAPVAGRVYLVVETFEPAPRSLDYEIRIDLVETEVCTGEVDEDADGVADCDDDECYGVPPCDAAETSCADGADNDDDGAADCADSDCAADPACGPYRGVFEVFGVADDIDLAGSSVTFTPDPGAPDGYATAVAPAVDFPVSPGSGVVSEAVILGDDDVWTQVFSVVAGVSLFGRTHRAMYVSSNGFVSFDDWTLSFWLDLDDFFSFPTVAGLMTDLTPALPSTDGDAIVHVDEHVDRVVVTYEHVPIWYDEHFGLVEGPNDFQISIAQDGTVVLTWLEINAFDAIVGLGNGVGTGPYPAPVDLVP